MPSVPEYILKGVSTLLAPYVPSLGEPEALRLMISHATAMASRGREGLLTLTEYSKLSGVSVSTLRNKVRLTGLQPAKRIPCAGGYANLYTADQLGGL